jgi:hypothetical protein
VKSVVRNAQMIAVVVVATVGLFGISQLLSRETVSGGLCIGSTESAFQKWFAFGWPLPMASIATPACVAGPVLRVDWYVAGILFNALTFGVFGVLVWFVLLAVRGGGAVTFSRKYILIALGLLVVVLVPSGLYDEQLSCLALGGSWERRHFLTGEFYHCRIWYPDRGDSCQSSVECIGGCTVPWHRIYLEGEQAIGECRANNDPGCIYFIENQVYQYCED